MSHKRITCQNGECEKPYNLDMCPVTGEIKVFPGDWFDEDDPHGVLQAEPIDLANWVNSQPQNIVVIEGQKFESLTAADVVDQFSDVTDPWMKEDEGRRYPGWAL